MLSSSTVSACLIKLYIEHSRYIVHTDQCVLVVNSSTGRVLWYTLHVNCDPILLVRLCLCVWMCCVCVGGCGVYVCVGE